MAEETAERLRRLAREWQQAAQHDAVGMGSATARSAQAVDSAAQAFRDELAHCPAGAVAAALLFEPADWCIWSFEHSAWWRPEKRGYTTHAALAGRYRRSEVLWILSTSDGKQNVPVHENHARDDTWPAVRGR